MTSVRQDGKMTRIPSVRLSTYLSGDDEMDLANTAMAEKERKEESDTSVSSLASYH